MGDRYFPATALGGQLYIDASAQDEGVVDVLVARVGHKKVRTAEELEEVVRTSERGLPAIRVWIDEAVRQVWGAETAGALFRGPLPHSYPKEQARQREMFIWLCLDSYGFRGF
jgi:hypothetical protein